MSWTVPMAAKFYRIPLVDYGQSRTGVLLGSGAGLMMAVMDQAPIRWCVDTDDLNLADPLVEERLTSFCRMAHAAPGGGVSLVGWFSLHDPEPLRRALAGLEPTPLVYVQATSWPGAYTNIQDLVEDWWYRYRPGTPAC